MQTYFYRKYLRKNFKANFCQYKNIRYFPSRAIYTTKWLPHLTIIRLAALLQYKRYAHIFKQNTAATNTPNCRT